MSFSIVAVSISPILKFVNCYSVFVIINYTARRIHSRLDVMFSKVCIYVIDLESF